SIHVRLMLGGGRLDTTERRATSPTFDTVAPSVVGATSVAALAIASRSAVVGFAASRRREDLLPLPEPLSLVALGAFGLASPSCIPSASSGSSEESASLTASFIAVAFG